MRQYFKDQQQLQWYPNTHSLRSRILSRSVFIVIHYVHCVIQSNNILPGLPLLCFILFLFSASFFPSSSSTSFCSENSPCDKHVTNSNNLLMYFMMSFIGERRIYTYIFQDCRSVEDVFNSDMNQQLLLLLLLLLLPILTLYHLSLSWSATDTSLLLFKAVVAVLDVW